jgi:hypothetical protein
MKLQVSVGHAGKRDIMPRLESTGEGSLACPALKNSIMRVTALSSAFGLGVAPKTRLKDLFITGGRRWD